MEGFWVVQFTGVQGFGAGVLTLIGGQIFGGDGGMLYSGTYSQTGNILQARVHVTRHTKIPGVQSVMGTDDFYLDLNGTLQGNMLTVSGTIPGTQMHLTAALKKQADLPVRG
jgi:hypothetical protein